MKQCTAILKDRDAFFEWLEKAKDSAEYKNSKEVLIKVMTTLVPEVDSRNLHSRLKEYFPKAKIIGLSMMPRSQKIVGIAEQVRAPMEKGEAYAIISIFYFDSSNVTIFDIDSNNTNSIQEMAFSLKRRLKKIPNLKGVEILSAGFHTYLADFLEMLTDGLEDVPFFGAMAGMEVKEKITCEYHNILNALQGIETTQFVIGKEYHLDGIVLAAYSGEDLHIDAHYDFGWKPVGKELKATKTLGISGLSTIDDEPAVSIYKKYLNIEPNDYLMFNVFEFPLLVDRGGVPASRVPLVYDEYGRLYFPSDIHQGETIRLSYGNPAELLKETKETGRNLKCFDPQAISIYICSVRMVFLADDAKKEIEIFRDILPDTAYCLANGEIFKYKGQGGVVGLALISVAFREGPPRNIYDITEPVAPVITNDSDFVVPLTKRLAAFLEATTDELNASNENLKDAVVAAEAASKSKSQFLSNMSHEIRTPINAILGMNEMILREATDETILEYAENIRSAGNSLLGIVNDILDFSKIEAGKMDIIPVEYSLSSLLNDLVNMVQKRAEKKNLEFHIDADENLPCDLYGDEIRIKQVITNILTNAVKYTEKGGVTLKVTFKNISADEILLCVSVKDTGIGIKPEDIKKLFSAFERIEEKRNRTIEGTGLGMNITQRLLEMMNSRLEVSSVYGEGSEFSFELAQKVINAHPIGNFAENYRNSLSQHKKYKEKFTAPDAKILVVDDTVMNLTVVKGLLKQTKVQIDTAESGFESLKLVTNNHYDIIFLDHRMPGLDGIETLKRMQTLEGNLNVTTPVISLTANAVSGAKQIYLDAGFQDYLTKPIDSAKLEEMMITYLPKEKVHFKDADESAEDDSADEKAKVPEWLKNVNGINVDEGIAHCGGVDAYMDALNVFAQSVTSGAREIAEFYRRGDIKNYTVKVHALKSSARVIGAAELSEKARRLEDAGNAGYVDEIKRFTDGLLELYISFADKLAPLIKTEEDDDNKPPIDDDALAEAYETMKEVAQTFDYDSMQFVIQSLEEYKLPPDEAKRFSEIKNAASKPDWEKVLEIVDS